MDVISKLILNSPVVNNGGLNCISASGVLKGLICDIWTFATSTQLSTKATLMIL